MTDARKELTMRTRYLDLETTGLDPDRDEILEVGLVDQDGTVLLDTLVRPIRRTAWPGAQMINGIPPAAVAQAPTLDSIRPRLIEAVAGTRVVIYNAAFDTGFLGQDLAGAAEICCAMTAFAACFPGRRWKKLTVAAEHVGFAWPGVAHRAVHDCLATRAVWQWVQAQPVPSAAVPTSPGLRR
jgi:DNA polymerase-3 subunit epsilon